MSTLAPTTNDDDDDGVSVSAGTIIAIVGSIVAIVGLLLCIGHWAETQDRRAEERAKEQEKKDLEEGKPKEKKKGPGTAYPGLWFLRRLATTTVVRNGSPRKAALDKKRKAKEAAAKAGARAAPTTEQRNPLDGGIEMGALNERFLFPGVHGGAASAGSGLGVPSRAPHLSPSPSPPLPGLTAESATGEGPGDLQLTSSAMNESIDGGNRDSGSSNGGKALTANSANTELTF